ncbi:unnamed protein product [Rotaria sp. Silwood2]|nr:unnamed protein product [Rotaria sp. Silwood2]CAF4299400.1 unnamed protein product [Rotaria sp. Silwood2]CAF4362703.1 unnamed protein product [Rotaria sp. Silwood2]
MHYALLFLCILLIDARIVLLHNLDDQLRIDDAVNDAIAQINGAMIKGWDDWDNWSDSSVETLEPGTSVCYPVVGCFDNNPPFDNAGLSVPQNPSLINTQFLLFTHSAPTNPEFLQYNQNDSSIIKSRFSNSKWLRIIVHGFTNNRNSLWIPRLTEELLKLKDNEASDVLVVDWGNGAKFPLYNNAAANTRLVGKEIALLLKKMKTLKQLSYDKVHCIGLSIISFIFNIQLNNFSVARLGHSLGAHTCGYASNEINRQMARISGLDPAGPFFEGKTAPVRLDQSDAKFIDVIHSNTEIALGVGLGSDDPSGHVDFYVNGGKQQPGCPSV